MLIGNILNLAIKSTLKKEYANFRTLQLINESYESQLSKIDQLQNDIKSITENASKSIALFVESLTKRFEKKLEISLCIDDDIIDEIINSNQKIIVIEKVFEKAVMIAMNTSVLTQENINIRKEHFSWPEISKKTQVHQQFNKHANILDILDRYENAASIAIDKGWKINGSSVGESCDPKVSPASIVKSSNSQSPTNLTATLLLPPILHAT